MSDKTEIRSTSSTGGQKGTKLQRFDLIPVGPLTELAEHYGRGAKKYADNQWRAGYEWGKSYSAMFRHLTQFWGGEDYDVCPRDRQGCADFPDEKHESKITERDYSPTCYNHTGSHHMVAVAWHAFLLLEFKDKHPGHDDRFVAETNAKPEPITTVEVTPPLSPMTVQNAINREINRMRRQGLFHSNNSPSDTCDNTRCISCHPRKEGQNDDSNRNSGESTESD